MCMSKPLKSSHTGIDFGTSNTTMAVRHDGNARLIPLEQDHLTIPTALFFPEARDAPILFGRAAQRAYLEGVEGRYLRSLKRLLGTSLMTQTTLLQGTRWQFPNIIAAFLRHIKQTAEQHMQQDIKRVTIGRPVHFQDNNHDADNEAEEQLRAVAAHVGFTDIRFQFEPVAAALAHEKRIIGEKMALVVDIGGGTSDFSVLRLSNAYTHDRDRAQDILANAGIRVGGNDCDRALNLAALMPLLGMGSHFGDKQLEFPSQLFFELSEWAKVNWCYTPQNSQFVHDTIRTSTAPDQLQRLLHVLEYHWGHRLLDISETLKIALSTDNVSQQDMAFLQEGLCTRMTQAQMNRLCATTWAPVRKAMIDTIKQAGLKPAAIEAVILTGGSTALPVFQEWVGALFPTAEIFQDDKLGSVGLGLVG